MRKLASPFMMRRRRATEVSPPEPELVPPTFTAVGEVAVLQPDGQPRVGNPRVGDRLVVSGWETAGDPAPQVSIRWQQQEAGTTAWSSLWGKGARFEWQIEEASLGARIRPQLIAESTAGATPWTNVLSPGVGPVEPENPATAPGRTPAPVLINATDTSLEVTWEDPEDGGSPITRYVVQHRKDGGGTTVTLSPATKPQLVDGLDPDSMYEVRVRCDNDVGEGAVGEWGEFRTSVEDVVGGPLRTLTSSLPRGIVLGGHSSLHPSNYDGLLAAAVGPVMSDGDKQSSQEVWESNGPSRTGDYDMLILSESDSYTAYYEGLADPSSSHGINNLQHMYWLGLEAKERGAELVLFNSPSARSNPVDPTNRARMNYYREWLETHLDMPVWVIPGELYVQELRDRGLTDDDIFTDQVHLRQGDVTRGAAYQAVAFVTGALPAGATGLYAEAALASVQKHWWSGLGGSEYEAGLNIADPLPEPLPRPDDEVGPEPDPFDGILWTADGYQGPELNGNQPTVSGSVMTFDGNGLSAPYVTSGFYACMAVRAGELSEDGVLLFVNPNPNDIYADPLHGMRLSQGHNSLVIDRWPAPGEFTVRPHTPDWVVVEGWVMGTEHGGFNGTTDAIGSAASPAPETPMISLFMFGRPIDCSYLRVAREMPDAETRIAWRAEAAETMPT